MSRMTAADMHKRVATTPAAAPAGKTGKKTPEAVPVTMKVPASGEVHVRKLKGGGHVATMRDSNYNTVQETFVPDSGQLRLE